MATLSRTALHNPKEAEEALRNLPSNASDKIPFQRMTRPFHTARGIFYKKELLTQQCFFRGYAHGKISQTNC